MKTPEQIKAWLEAQPWYEQFKNNTLDPDINIVNPTKCEEDSARTLSGYHGDLTIVLSFRWFKTNEGYIFWANIDNQFCKWYNEENPD